MPRITDVGQLRTHLTAFRRAHRLTQADLAVQLGVTKQRISAIESAPERVTVNQFMAVLRALRVDLFISAHEERRASVADNEGW